MAVNQVWLILTEDSLIIFTRPGTQAMTPKIGSFVMNCKDFDKTVAFWQEGSTFPEGQSRVISWY